jgi:hypothetical protein
MDGLLSERVEPYRASLVFERSLRQPSLQPAPTAVVVLKRDTPLVNLSRLEER